MPSKSRKKMKGQARKAKAAALKQHKSGSNECRHMELDPSSSSDDKVVGNYLSTFFRNMLSNSFEVQGPLYSAAIKALDPGAVNNEHNLNSVKKNIISNGVDDLLGGVTSLRLAHGCAAALMLIDSYSPLSEVPVGNFDERDGKFMLKNVDVLHGCERSLVKFFVNRIPCNCLDELYSRASTIPKMGLCRGCEQKKDRNSLYICTGCERVQYCNKACQLADVPDHKDYCKIWQSGRCTYDVLGKGQHDAE